MGYTRIVQAGNITHIFNYEKNLYVSENRRYIKRKKRRKTQDYRDQFAISLRSRKSIQRSKTNFFNLVTANLQGEQPVTFITLTYFEQVDDVTVGYIDLKAFFKRLRAKNAPNLRYISVPEWQKNGKIHFHCLVWGLEPEIEQKERVTRNVQRQWARGYCDVRTARDASAKISSYMAKYMAKASEDQRLRNIRAYSFSRNCKRPYKTGSNSIINFMDLIQGVDNPIDLQKSYETIWLGRCDYKRHVKQ